MLDRIIDARRLYAGAGYSSTFRYCIEVLRLSEDAAFNRIEVARTASLLPARPSVDANGREIPTAGAEGPAAGAPAANSSPELLRAAGSSGTVALSRPLVRPLAADRYEIRFTASAETRDYRRRAQDLLGHAILRLGRIERAAVRRAALPGVPPR